MKAAVVLKKGNLPKYVGDFAEPEAENGNEVLISVKASAVKNLDKMRASGQHYSTQNEAWKAKVAGGDGVGVWVRLWRSDSGLRCKKEQRF